MIKVSDLIDILKTANPEIYISFTAGGPYSGDAVEVTEFGVTIEVGGMCWAEYES